jgi:glycosyltransferase involved in cell wall biosynthesis
MIAWIKRLRTECEDRLRFSPRVRGTLSRWKILRDACSAPKNDQALAHSIRRLCAAVLLAPTETATARGMERIRRRLERLDSANIDWSDFFPRAGDRRLYTAAVLKPYVSEREKGVLFFSFEHSWVRLLTLCDYRALAQRYTLVLAPSWSPPHSIVSYVFPRAWPDPVLTLLSNRKDLELFPRISPKYVPVPLFASSWVNPDLFEPLPRDQRDIDLLMVANFGKFKRHHALFRALRHMPPARILLIGQDQDGRTADTIRALARTYGVADRFTLVANAAYEEVAKALCRSRASVILSRREGSCVVVAESLFADTPVGLLEDAAIGSREFINPSTGCLLREDRLAEQLQELIATADRYAPRRWAEKNIACLHSSRLLNDALRQHQTARGEEWTCDIAPLCWRPDPRLVHAADRRRLRAERQDIRDRFGIEIGPPETE